MVDRRHSLMDELSYLPEGELYIRKDNGLHNYYQRFRRTGNRKKERRKGVKKDPELLNALVRKKYVTEALSILEKDLAATEQLLKVYILSDENSVMEGFVNKFPELAEGIYIIIRSAIEEGVVDMTLLTSQRLLLFQRLQRGSLRIAVRHIEVAGNATGSCRTALRIDVCLFRQARLTEVYVVVDDTWQYVATRGIYRLVE